MFYICIGNFFLLIGCAKNEMMSEDNTVTGVHLQIRPMYSGENRRNDDGSVYRSIIGKNIL